jgi:hypothetical protein
LTSFSYPFPSRIKTHIETQKVDFQRMGYDMHLVRRWHVCLDEAAGVIIAGVCVAHNMQLYASAFSLTNSKNRGKRSHTRYTKLAFTASAFNALFTLFSDFHDLLCIEISLIFCPSHNALHCA